MLRKNENKNFNMYRQIFIEIVKVAEDVEKCTKLLQS